MVSEEAVKILDELFSKALKSIEEDDSLLPSEAQELEEELYDEYEEALKDIYEDDD